ncbi:class I SAM-dependent methyltransferase [Pantanalinema rosaneae CENA516]|uniref:class I SAM-dependent methyltransferase n=1 Tax=Pantanalinema rosaneae TaxID=1620701 RepID=UPI003D6F2B25
MDRLRDIEDILPLLRSPGKRGGLRLAKRSGLTPPGRAEALLLDDDSRLCFPVIGGVPRLLPASNRIMADAAADLPAFEEARDHALPVFGGGGAELDHYEVNGVHDVTTAAFDDHRVDVACGLLPAEVATLVDIGAGPGPFLARLAKARPDMLAFGLERSSAAVAAAPGDVAMIQGTADALPLADACVDCAVSMETLEHLPDPVHRAALAEMARVSRRYVLVNVPYRERRLQTRCRHCDCVFNPNYHMRSYDDARLDALMPGFAVRERILLPREENLLKALAAPFRKQVFGRLDYAICPQCGMSGADEAAPSREPAPAGGAGGARGALKALAGFLPRVPVRGEILVLYERRQ